MKKMNFVYMKRSRKIILLDRLDLIVWRRNYLLRIKAYRKLNKQIYYTYETRSNEGHTSSYVWMDNDIESSRQAFLNGLSRGLKNPNEGRRLIVTHIGSNEGFLEDGELIFQAKKTDAENNYHGEMDAHNFEKWFKKILEKVRVPSLSWITQHTTPES
ncbi:uncharacterized protein LOC126368757 [Pectinophora gossypiella]|uniref:uncharacterized protein LOC126368757 n=1 Tax=Pectinophora gossypiella TaxID=13191 RepID=UPI00214F006B|nr:uncharacterized protein LOC126368757 [Pectinophora gossypiella]